MRIRVSGCSDRGLVRDANEDVLLVDAELGLFAVLDGIGGAAAGELAARTAADALQLSLWHDRYRAGPEADRQNRLREAVLVADRAVRQEAASSGRLRGMGCTLTAVQIVDDRAIVAHVGDSRLYLVRGRIAHQITQDHTLAAELVRQGRLDRSGSRHHPGAHVLTQSLGGGREVSVEGHQLELRAGDRLLLCTDGLSDYVDGPEDLVDMVSSSPIDAAVADLVGYALDRGGHDNITILAIEMSAGAAPPPHCGTSFTMTGRS
ncbi:MAG: protein phosphatase 2C domain-containing protein [Acidimicrobiales bacterium]